MPFKTNTCTHWITRLRESFLSFNTFFLSCPHPSQPVCLTVSSSLSASPYQPLWFSRQQVQGGVLLHTHINTSGVIPAPAPPSPLPEPVAKACRTFPSVLLAAASSNWGANIACHPCESQSSEALKQSQAQQGGHISYHVQSRGQLSALQAKRPFVL